MMGLTLNAICVIPLALLAQTQLLLHAIAAALSIKDNSNQIIVCVKQDSMTLVFRIAKSVILIAPHVLVLPKTVYLVRLFSSEFYHLILVNAS